MQQHTFNLWVGLKDKIILNVSHEISLGRFQIFSCQILMSKVVGFHLKVTKTLFWTGGVWGYRPFMACFRSDFFMQSSVSCLECAHVAYQINGKEV